MNVTLDKNAALEILKAYYDIAHLSVKLYDTDCNLIARYPEVQTAEYCQFLRENKEISTQCSLCYHHYFTYIKEQGMEEVKYNCHANVLNILVPIKKGDKLFGYLYLRHARSEEIDNQLFLNDFAKKYNLDIDKITDTFKKLPLYSEEKFKSTIRILEICLSYFIANQIITLEEDPMMNDIRAYIKDHIADDLSIQTLCKKFYIDKNNLYNMFERYEKTTVSKYIIAQKIELAKSLLKYTNDSIQDISEKIGIQNYNYFIIFFRKNTGISPLRFRKSKN